MAHLSFFTSSLSLLLVYTYKHTHTHIYIYPLFLITTRFTLVALLVDATYIAVYLRTLIGKTSRVCHVPHRNLQK